MYSSQGLNDLDENWLITSNPVSILSVLFLFAGWGWGGGI